MALRGRQASTYTRIDSTCMHPLRAQGLPELPRRRTCCCMKLRLAFSLPRCSAWALRCSLSRTACMKAASFRSSRTAPRCSLRTSRLSRFCSARSLHAVLPVQGRPGTPALLSPGGLQRTRPPSWPWRLHVQPHTSAGSGALPTLRWPQQLRHAVLPWRAPHLSGSKSRPSAKSSSKRGVKVRSPGSGARLRCRGARPPSTACLASRTLCRSSCASACRACTAHAPPSASS